MKRYLVGAAILIAAFAAQAQGIKVSTGGAGNTYSKMFNQLAGKCRETGLSLTEAVSSGSVENVARLVGNETQAAIVQTDVIYLQARTDDRLNSIKTLFTLHPEEVHVVALTGKKVGGTMGFGGTALESVAQLGGGRVGAAGGSVVTAKVIQLLGEINFQIVEFGSTKEALEAMSKNNVDAVVAVGGAPLGDVEALGRGVHLLAINDRVAEKLKSVYVPAKLNYTKLSESMGVPTVATEAILVVQDYRSPKIVGSLASLRECVRANLDDLRDEPGTHPKWKSVNLDNKGKWTWYNLPEAPAPARRTK
jgi:hypothetical protein